jgi:glycosyltransferase involved in cell wall biosynthesis
MAALAARGHEVALATRLRSFDRDGDARRQARIAALGARIAGRLIARYAAARPADRPQAWLTYHLYYKAPDWIGPRVADALGIPYVVVEASLAAKRAQGPWRDGHAAVLDTLRHAAAVLSFHARDEAALRGAVAEPGRLHRLRPFLDAQPFAAAADARDGHRARIAAELGLDPATPWLLAVGMMRSGDKLASYRVLAQALAACTDRPWTLLVAGDGPARPAVETAFAPLATRTRLLGACAPARLAALCAAAELFVWPAVNEAWGMALLEAQAAGLPAVAGDSGGVGEILRDGRTGWLVPMGDAAAFARAVAAALDDPAARRARGAAARATVAAEHDLDAAGRVLERVLAGASGRA